MSYNTRGGRRHRLRALVVFAAAACLLASSAIAPLASAETQAAARPADPAQAMARPDAPVPLQAIAVEIGMRAMRGSREFAIRLDPEDLGRIDIRLEISEAGQVQAKLVVDKVETLQLLQRFFPSGVQVELSLSLTVVVLQR
jgi:flagellar hook-length control protein FliK